MKKVFSIIGRILLFAAAAFGLLLLFSVRWALRTWPDLKMEEIVFELQAPLEGTGNGMIGMYLARAALPAAVCFIALIVLYLLIARKKKGAALIMTAVCTAVFLSVAGYLVFHELALLDYLKGEMSYSTFIEENYVDPSEAVLTFPEKKRNLIYIYLESMETTYADKESGGAFDFNCIPELTELAKQHEDFSGSSDLLNGGKSMTGTTWTMGAMFAETSGLPLKISIGNNGMNSQDAFFPAIRTLGDILDEEGYRQTLCIGSDATFGGRELYFTGHGNYDMFDYDYCKANGLIPNGYKVWWGFEDERLFGLAKERLTELASGDEPFNFTLLTVDTHFEDGYVCRLCEDEFEGNQYANVMACSSRQVTEFVDWITKQDFFENTTVILSGDHPTMDRDFCSGTGDYQRKVYTCYINSAVEPEKPDQRREFTTFDDFPTTLAALGVKIEGERLGLGTNLFSGVPTLTETYGVSEVNEELKKKSKLLSELEYVDPEALTRHPSGYCECTGYNEETGELALRVYDIYSMPAKLAAIRGEIRDDDGFEQTVEVPGSEIDTEGSVTLTFNVDPEPALLGRFSITLVDVNGDEFPIIADEQSPLLRTEAGFADLLGRMKIALQYPENTVLIASRGKYRSRLTDEIKEAFKGLGVTADFDNAEGNAFVLSLHEDDVDMKIGKGEKTLEGTLEGGVPYYVKSTGKNADGETTILVDGDEYAGDQKGLSVAVYNARYGVIYAKEFPLSESVRKDSTIETVGKFMKFGRIHVQVTDMPLGHPQWYKIALQYWYDDDPANVKTMIMHRETAKIRTAVIKGRIFPRSDLHLRVYAVISKQRWRVIGEQTFSIR